MNEKWLRKEMKLMIDCYRQGNQKEGERRFNELVRNFMKISDKSQKKGKKKVNPQWRE